MLWPQLVSMMALSQALALSSASTGTGTVTSSITIGSGAKSGDIDDASYIGSEGLINESMTISSFVDSDSNKDVADTLNDSGNDADGINIGSNDIISDIISGISSGIVGSHKHLLSVESTASPSSSLQSALNVSKSLSGLIDDSTSSTVESFTSVTESVTHSSVASYSLLDSFKNESPAFSSTDDIDPLTLLDRSLQVLENSQSLSSVLLCLSTIECLSPDTLAAEQTFKSVTKDEDNDKNNSLLVDTVLKDTTTSLIVTETFDSFNETQFTLVVSYDAILEVFAFNSTNQSLIDINPLNETDVKSLNFMSFEEWKRKKENSTNQSKNGVNNTEKAKSNVKAESIPANNKSLSLVTKPNRNQDLSDNQLTNFKNKFNYASIDCAATIAQTNNDAKYQSSILLESKESYLLNRCNVPNKFVIIELCQDILVEGVVIGNFEFFSSTFKDVKILVSETFPSSNWHSLGEFEAKNVRDVQTFKIDTPIIWAKYLKIEILSHYGNEFYCPISVVRVYGKTMMDEVKEDTISQKIVEDQESLNTLPLNTSTGLDDNFIDKCQVVLPYLQMADFLSDYNTTQNDICEIPEPSQSHTISTQESFYKNTIKRLSLLESNATLSLLYIEEQSKLLSQAFKNLESRQSGNFETLIHSFNESIVNQLTRFQESYFRMHTEYSTLFKVQEKNHEELMSESKSKLSILSREILFQKAIAIINSSLILCLLVYVVLTKVTFIDDKPIKVPTHRKPKEYIVGSLAKPSFKKRKRRI